jgi:SHS2 domain-containing protein
MKKFEILPHRADLKIKVFAKNKEDLFLNSMIAMFEASKTKGEGKIIKRKIKVKSFDLFSLLVDFLSELLYLSEVKNEVYFDIKFKKFTGKEIEGEIFGKKIKKRGIIIKGVTYHDLEIRQKRDKTFEATILFDI